MPECYRCERVQSTAEMRRTKLGWLCKDNGRFSPCARLAKELRARLKVSA